MKEIILENTDKTREWLLSEDTKDTENGSAPVVRLYVKTKGEDDCEFVRSFDSFESATEYVAMRHQVFGPVEVNKTISRNDINKTRQVLIDNGIEEDEADTVLQAIGYTLCDAELFGIVLPSYDAHTPFED